MVKLTLLTAALAVFGVTVTVTANNPPAGCNFSRKKNNYNIEAAPIGDDESINITLLPQDKGNLSPAALDGSPYGFYFRPSPSGKSTKWTINLQGGGWCYDEVDCYCRSGMGLGTSVGIGQGTCRCLNPLDNGGLPDDDCNCLDLPYLDGASFSGYKALPVAVPGTNETIYFRGIKNLDGTLEWAFENTALKDSTELVLSGASAGGLATFLHADRVIARVQAGAPKCTKAVAHPTVGFFLDHDNFKHTTGYPGGPNTPQWSAIGTSANYTFWMKYIYTMQNLTFGEDGGLMQECQAKFPTEPWLCFMSPHMSSVVTSPIFMENSKYDAWQLRNIFQSPFDSHDEQTGVLEYGESFLTQFNAFIGAKKNVGAFITSCICHSCPGEQTLGGKTSYEHFADWFHGRTVGSASVHVDPSTSPNGNGTFHFKHCHRWAPVV